MKKQIIITILLALAITTLSQVQSCGACSSCTGDQCYKPPSYSCSGGCKDNGSPVNS
jgi:hypothetical protein